MDALARPRHEQLPTAAATLSGDFCQTLNRRSPSLTSERVNPNVPDRLDSRPNAPGAQGRGSVTTYHTDAAGNADGFDLNA